MYDSRQFLQFIVDRNLGFDHDRQLGFDSDRLLLFDHDRELGFDPSRAHSFGKCSPVFRGQACPDCKHLIAPLDDQCRYCGTRVASLREVVPTKRKVTKKQLPKGAKQICPNCSLKIPGDAVYCPRCRVKLSEWEDYIQDLRRYEQDEMARKAQAQRRPQQRPYDDRYHNAPRRRR